MLNMIMTFWTIINKRCSYLCRLLCFRFPVILSSHFVRVFRFTAMNSSRMNDDAREIVVIFGFEVMFMMKQNRIRGFR